MKISIDRRRCEGHALCTAQAPAAFDLDDDGTAVSRFQDREIPDDHTVPARAAADAGPVAALREWS
ncbi:ferredoxin [Nocardia wallacei]|uniref:ferredoxin n=1 Tax=Nocardia wallacei TaxID=480035 RepID=UPI00245592F8|nr:ferredoxin [Nocardia wallacei]